MRGHMNIEIVSHIVLCLVMSVRWVGNFLVGQLLFRICFLYRYLHLLRV